MNMASTGKRVVVVIDPLGKPTVEAVGFNGQGCTDATKAIEAALAGGGGGVERVLKPEWHNANDASNEVQQHTQW